jgi:hypothetical protein
MSPKNVTSEEVKTNTNPGKSTGLAFSRLVVAAADANVVMREQLDFLIEHAENGTCGCRQCQRYIRARALLLEIFGELSLPAPRPAAGA